MKIAAAFLAALSLLIAPAAFAGEAIVKSEVSVDTTGRDSAEAKSSAMAKANTEALTDLLNKLAAPGQAEIITSSLDAKKIASMTRGTEVLEEKITDNRYRARLLISFDADEISNLIGKFGIGTDQSNIPSKTSSFLFITSFEEDNSVVLWEERNPWRNVWRMVGLEHNSGDIVVPFGDNNDQQIIDERTMASANYAALAPLAIRYGVSDVVILQAKFEKNPDMLLTVVKRRVNRTLNEVNVTTYRADPQETRDTLLMRAARDIADNLQNKKSEEIATVQGVSAGEKGKMMVLASLTTLGSWTTLKAKLETLPMIERLEMLAMSPQQVDMIVHYRGTPESLAGGITGIGLRLVKNEQYWVISRD